MSNVIEVNGDLSQWVNSREKRLVVIDFFATWCGPCKRMHPIYDDLSVRYKNVVFLRVDSDRNRNLSGEYGVTGLPTFVLVVRGSEVDRVVGADPNGLEAKINQYATSGGGFSGTGMTLGGSTDGPVDAAKAREMRLKRFGGIKMTGSGASSKMANMMTKMRSDLSEDEEEVKVDTEGDQSLRDTLLSMGFSAANVDKTFSECKSRDLTDLVVYLTSLPEEPVAEEQNTVSEEVIQSKESNEAHEVQTSPSASNQPQVVCDGDQCRLVTPEAPAKSFEVRVEETKAKMQQRKLEKEKEEKERERIREKERIERGKQDQQQREELERLQRKREIEKEKREKMLLEQEKKRQLDLWRKEHGLPPVQEEKRVEKTLPEKAKLLVESLMMQTVDKAGPLALRAIKVILLNTAKPDPKYRQMKKDNAMLQKRIISVPGALPLLCLGGFELENDVYVMKSYDEEKVNAVLSAIPKQF